MKFGVSGLPNNEIGILLNQNGADEIIKPLKILFKYNFTIKWPTNVIIIMAMIFHDFYAKAVELPI